MNSIVIPPAFILLAGAFITGFLPARLRSAWFVVLGTGTLGLVSTFTPALKPLSLPVMNYQLVVLKVDTLSRGFGIVFSLIIIAGGIFSYHIKDKGQQCAALLYAGSALGVVFAGDFFSLFFFWEMMAISSTILIWARRTPRSRQAGTRYILFHALGGGILLAGILAHVHALGGDISCANLPETGTLGGWLMLIGVIINAAVPPLHAWLVDAYPRATITGAVFLNAFTTKTAVFVLIKFFLGWKILLILGTIMALYGVIYTVLANDMRGILSYHIVSQVGYMVAAVGIGGDLGANGAAAHAFSNIFFKGLLFMAAGAVMAATGRSRLTRLGGLGRDLKWVCLLYMVGAFSIAGFPLFNGFITKSMVLAAAAGEHYSTVFLLLNLAAVGTFLSVGLKLPFYAFFHREKPDDLKVKKVPLNMYVGMGMVGLICILHGIVPQLLYDLLPRAVGDFHPYTLLHVSEVVQMFAFVFIGFWLFRKTILKPKELILIDLDWFYRKPAALVRMLFVDGTVRIFDEVNSVFMRITRKLVQFGRNPLYYLLPGRQDDGEYSPDKYRPRLSVMVFGLLLVFILIVTLGII